MEFMGNRALKSLLDEIVTRTSARSLAQQKEEQQREAEREAKAIYAEQVRVRVRQMMMSDQARRQAEIGPVPEPYQRRVAEQAPVPNEAQWVEMPTSGSQPLPPNWDEVPADKFVFETRDE